MSVLSWRFWGPPAVLAATTGAAAAQEGPRTVRYEDHGTVRPADGVRLQALPDPGAPMEGGRLGVLVEGTVEVAALRPLSLDAAGRRVELAWGLLRLRVEADRLHACLLEGAATVADEVLDPGACAAWDATGRLPEAPSAIAAPPPASPPAEVPDIEDDPRTLIESLLGTGARGGEGGDGEGGEQSGGAAACLDSGDAGGEATGPDGPDLPDTEIDRSRHRVNLQVTLEGF
ncbi:MAG: hypothetical protein QME96_03635 [Myxococcota bacterium]|nr:hypothetical protein [Myxococcota bacterium]